MRAIESQAIRGLQIDDRGVITVVVMGDYSGDGGFDAGEFLIKKLESLRPEITQVMMGQIKGNEELLRRFREISLIERMIGSGRWSVKIVF